MKKKCVAYVSVSTYAREALEGMRDFVTDKPAQIPDGLKKLHACLKTLPCSRPTAECERGFSLMNIISTDLRSALLVKTYQV